MKTFDKDDEALLDYEWDWTDWLGTDTIADAQVAVASGSIVIEDVSFANGKVTAWISGGTVHEPSVATCTITTAEGRVDERSARFVIKER